MTTGIMERRNVYKVFTDPRMLHKFEKQQGRKLMRLGRVDHVKQFIKTMIRWTELSTDDENRIINEYHALSSCATTICLEIDRPVETEESAAENTQKHQARNGGQKHKLDVDCDRRDCFADGGCWGSGSPGDDEGQRRPQLCFPGRLGLRHSPVCLCLFCSFPLGASVSYH
ncbi:hypothetical protein HK096_003220, partial [Nowakowskiella sp. JEL0078]